jgi:plastocyanin
MRSSFSFVIAVSLLLFAGSMNAYSSGESWNGAYPDQQLASSTVDVSIINFAFDPAVIAIEPGDTVRWTNVSGAIPHTSTSGGPFDPTPGSVWDSGFMSNGDSYSFVFDSADDYDYFCTIHPLLMFGTVIVGGTGLKVALTPDDISPGSLANLDVEVTILNFTPQAQSGDLWFTVVLPNSNEIEIPAQFLSLLTNPLSGQVPAGGRLDLPVTIFVPGGAPSGHYEIKAMVGIYPSGVVGGDSFGFDIP